MLMSVNDAGSVGINDIGQKAWDKLAEKRIYFGHQSVGAEIVSGIEDIVRKNPLINLNVIESSDPASYQSPLFGHSKIGRNKEPISKISGFVEMMENGIGDNVDIAFLKLCFVDITAQTDVNGLFAFYKEKLLRLKETCSKTKFVHMTVPLTTVQTGVKAFVKRIIDRPVGGYEDNLARHRYNAMLRMEYQSEEYLFDLAKIESITDIGKQIINNGGRETFPSLAPEYTYDGAHLNDLGRENVAGRLMIFLANLSESTN